MASRARDIKERLMRKEGPGTFSIFSLAPCRILLINGVVGLVSRNAGRQTAMCGAQPRWPEEDTPISIEY